MKYMEIYGICLFRNAMYNNEFISVEKVSLIYVSKMKNSCKCIRKVCPFTANHPYTPCLFSFLAMTIGRIMDKMVESGVMFTGLFSVMEFCNIVQNSVTSINYEIPVITEFHNLGNEKLRNFVIMEFQIFPN